MGILDGRLQVMECGDGGGCPGSDRGECRNEVKTQRKKIHVYLCSKVLTFNV